MKLSLSTLLIAFFFIQAISAATLPREKFTDHLDKRITELMEVYDIPGANIALISKGEVFWSKAYGYADLSKKIKMTTSTYCRVESISKSVTTWGVMKLVQQGKVALDKPVNHYIKSWQFPESKFPTDTITVRLLLSHNAGMPLGTIGVRYSPEKKIPSLRESLRRDAVLVQEPGTSFSYSNTGFNILELLIEEVTGQKFADFMRKEVLLPLGMNQSSFEWSKDFYPPVPNGYTLHGTPVPVYVYPDKASGGLFASLNDIATFVIAGMTNYSSRGLTVLDKQSIRHIYSPLVHIPGLYGLAFESYGAGHFVEQLSNGKTAVSHGGQGTGWMTHFHSIPETGDAIIILTNSQRSWPFFSCILHDWSEYNGFSSVGMGRIAEGIKFIWIFISLLFLISIWQICRIISGLRSGFRRFSPRSKDYRFTRTIEGLLFITITSGLFWAVSQDYLFITSVFPVASPWLGTALLTAACVSIISALMPAAKPAEIQQDDPV